MVRCKSVYFWWNNWALWCWWYLIRDNQVGKRPLLDNNTLLLDTELTSEARPFVERPRPCGSQYEKASALRWLFIVMHGQVLAAIECGGQVVSFTAHSLQRDFLCVTATVLLPGIPCVVCVLSQAQSGENPAGLGCWYCDWTRPVIYPAPCY